MLRHRTHLLAAAIAALLLALAPAAATAKPKPGHATVPAVAALQIEDDEAEDEAFGDDEWSEEEWDLEGYCEDAAKRPTAATTAACVGALERVVSGAATEPGQACQGVSRKKAKGQRGGTPFSDCVRAATWLLEDLAEEAEADAEDAADELDDAEDLAGEDDL